MKLNFHVPLMLEGKAQKDSLGEEFKESDIIYQCLNIFDSEDWIRPYELAQKVKAGEGDFSVSDLDLIEKAMKTPKVNWPNFFRAVIKMKIDTAKVRIADEEAKSRAKADRK